MRKLFIAKQLLKIFSEDQTIEKKNLQTFLRRQLKLEMLSIFQSPKNINFDVYVKLRLTV